MLAILGADGLRRRSAAAVVSAFLVMALWLGILSGCTSSTNGSVSQKAGRDSLEGEFVIVEDYSYIGANVQYEYSRAFISKDGEFYLIDAPYKSTDQGSLMLGKTYDSHGVVDSYIFYVGEYGVVIRIVEGTVKGSGREDLYLKKADRTIKIIHAGKKVKILGEKRTTTSSSLTGVPIFKVTSVEEIS
jgi:hypothetical protein